MVSGLFWRIGETMTDGSVRLPWKLTCETIGRPMRCASIGRVLATDALTASDPMYMPHDFGGDPRSVLIISTRASIAKFQL